MIKINWPYAGLIYTVFLPYFQKHGEQAIPFLVDGNVSSMAFLSAYKSLPPIDQMEEKEKREMKLYIISLFPNKTTAEKLDACRIVYAIGSLL